MSDLPKGWASTTLKTVVAPYESIDPRRQPERKFRYVDIGSIDNRIQKITEPKEFLGREAPSRARRVMKTDDVLFATVRTYLKNIALVTEDLDGELTTTGIVPLRSNNAITPKYLFNWVRSDRFIASISKSQSGTLYPAVSETDILDAKISVPPLTEQKRIVAKLDELNSRTASARDALDYIPALIEKFRTRVLALSFNGGLIGKIESETTLPESRCWNLPADWRWVRFEEVATVAASLVRPDSILALPHIAPNNIQSGTTKLLSYQTIGEDGVTSAKQRFYPGQILYSKIRPYLRKAVLVDFDGACSADMYPINVGSQLEAKFLLYWLVSEDFAQFSALREGRTVLPKINKKELNSTPLPLPPKEQQAEIVRRIETAFAWLDRVSDEYTAASNQLSRLDASILQKAFRGELVPQNLNDEPASILIERIKTESEAIKEKTSSGRKAAARPHKPIKRGEKMANLIEVMKSKEGWVSASYAAQALGVGDGATSDAVEEFYNELRIHLQNGDLEVERRGNEDWLRLMPISEE
ncbi:hypothetical protein FS592_16310 [Serratia plymuthica]|uniref:restriction endonuclease subunit S n=1 Tax=Serratia TaxID=613 RepID=UPI00124A92DB|nr:MULTISPECIES: restriction endonuclease subunit S [Serratia]KAB1578828.1 hypothetical protein F7687_21505 [Serratia marcescens]MCW7606374.1 restriction endonuclease subunit S [Serratia bockelmannii]MDX7539803.1 restriction endonuclease subunit S [Serratia marcescens]UJE00057.1 hypothetical protein FS592_16310 [Serratia plymuthica]